MQHLFDRVISIVNDVIELFYPRICGGCNSHLMKHEQNLCLPCLTKLPKTYYWDYDVNPVEKLFWGRIKVNSACSFLHFIKLSPTQKMLHRLKYENKTGIGVELGRSFAVILKEKKWFSDADLIVPVPLHPSKEMRRGYNQSAHIANGMGDVLGLKVQSRALTRTVASKSQTKKARFERVENVKQVFKISKRYDLKGKNVLLVDDVVTTGATLEAAGKCLLEAGVARLYIATVACA